MHALPPGLGGVRCKGAMCGMRVVQHTEPGSGSDAACLAATGMIAPSPPTWDSGCSLVAQHPIVERSVHMEGRGGRL